MCREINSRHTYLEEHASRHYIRVYDCMYMYMCPVGCMYEPCSVHESVYVWMVSFYIHNTLNYMQENYIQICVHTCKQVSMYLCVHMYLGHYLRARAHSYALPEKDVNNFIPRMLYTNILIYLTMR